MEFLTSSPFFFILGILFLFTLAGAWVWFEDLGLKMNWWKWALAVIWWLMLWATLAAPMTLLAEIEPKGALATLGIMGVGTIVLGVGLWRVLAIGREKAATK